MFVEMMKCDITGKEILLNDGFCASDKYGNWKFICIEEFSKYANDEKSWIKGRFGADEITNSEHSFEKIRDSYDLRRQAELKRGEIAWFSPRKFSNFFQSLVKNNHAHA